MATASTISVAMSMLTLVVGGMGGSETYARALTRQLADHPEVDVTAFVPASAAGFSEGVPERVIESVRQGPTTRERLLGVTSAFLHGRSIRTEMSDADVVHYPFTVPAPGPSRGQALVQSLLDIQHLDYPGMFSRAERLYRKPFYEGTARRADAIVTISNFAKGRISERLGIAPEKIHVAHLGVDASRFRPNLGPRDEFLLYPARGWPHKNHRRLIEAMTTIRRSRPDMKLVLTGGGLSSIGDVPPWVERRGLVSVDELHNLYSTAAAVVVPSLYEGFGLPPLEAMASGCPTAVASAGSLPEICGDAAVTFDPLDPEAIAEGVLDALARSSELSRAGILHAARFTWESCRDAHIHAYRSARG